MPMYDFHCPSCGHRFEAIQPSGNPNPPCPTCSRPTQRQLGAPAVHGTMSRGRELAMASLQTATGPCPACAAGRPHRHDH